MGPDRITLSQNYPNPFNTHTTIRYELPTEADVVMELFNTVGQRVATLVSGVQEQGQHESIIDGHGLASGVYMYRLSVKPATAGGSESGGGASAWVEVRRCVLLR
jgi:hypothetical protein